MDTPVAEDRTGQTKARVALAPLADTSTFAERAYVALKDVILSIDVYEGPGEVRLDERALAQDLGISRTPVREAMAQLEREGFVRSVPRRGIYVVRKTKQEVIESDHRLGGARGHGGTLDHAARERPGDRQAAADVHQVRERSAAREAR